VTAVAGVGGFTDEKKVPQFILLPSDPVTLDLESMLAMFVTKDVLSYEAPATEALFISPQKIAKLDNIFCLFVLNCAAHAPIVDPKEASSIVPLLTITYERSFAKLIAVSALKGAFVDAAVAAAGAVVDDAVDAAGGCSVADFFLFKFL